MNNEEPDADRALDRAARIILGDMPACGVPFSVVFKRCLEPGGMFNPRGDEPTCESMREMVASTRKPLLAMNLIFMLKQYKEKRAAQAPGYRDSEMDEKAHKAALELSRNSQKAVAAIEAMCRIRGAELPVVRRRCVACGNHALKKCARCNNAWYCGRECQVSNWSLHRKDCVNPVAAKPGSSARAETAPKRGA